MSTGYAITIYPVKDYSFINICYIKAAVSFAVAQNLSIIFHP
jgi:hypothetical protein